MLVTGKTYFGPHNARRAVMSVEGDTVTYFVPATLERASTSVEDFTTWCRESARRSYVGADGERRTKVGAGDVFCPDTKQQIAVVHYVTPAAPYQPIAATADDWATWRATAV